VLLRAPPRSSAGDGRGDDTSAALFADVVVRIKTVASAAAWRSWRFCQARRYVGETPDPALGRTDADIASFSVPRAVTPIAASPQTPRFHSPERAVGAGYGGAVFIRDNLASATVRDRALSVQKLQ
jgi:hypothetical protein